MPCSAKRMRRKPRLPRYALDALAVVQDDDLRAPALQHALLRPGCGRDLDAFAGVVLHEHVDQPAVGAVLFRVEDRLAIRIGAERAGLELAEFGVAHAPAAQRLGAVARLRSDIESEPGEDDRDGQRERIYRQVKPFRADAAGPDGGHFTLVVEPPESEHRREQHADGHQHHEVLERRQSDQREHDVVREPALRRDPEDAGELVAHEDCEQYDGDAREGRSRLLAGRSGRWWQTRPILRGSGERFRLNCQGHGKPARQRAQRAIAESARHSGDRGSCSFM